MWICVRVFVWSVTTQEFTVNVVRRGIISHQQISFPVTTQEFATKVVRRGRVLIFQIYYIK